MGLKSRIKSSWNIFLNRSPTEEKEVPGYTTMFTSNRPDRNPIGYNHGRSIMAPVINKIAVSCAQIEIIHAKVDENDRFEKVVKDELNDIFNLRANIDQASRAFKQDIFQSLCDEGEIAILPITVDDDLREHETIKIYTARVAKIIKWEPMHVTCRCYNELTGEREDIRVPKENVAIVENPFYEIMNEPNSTLQRLVRKMNLIDAIDEQSGSGRLDLIIQLPYVVKTPSKQAQADLRKRAIEDQLRNSKYGIAYIDGSEHVTQLNRPAENNLMAQVQYLEKQFFSQIGMPPSVLDGTADEQTMINYFNDVIEPLLAAVVEECRSKFLSNTARTRGHTIMYLHDPFKLIPAEKMADIADKYTRNEILSSNEIRTKIGYKPVKTQEAEELRNKNLNKSPDQQSTPIALNKEEKDQNGKEEI